MRRMPRWVLKKAQPSALKSPQTALRWEARKMRLHEAHILCLTSWEQHIFMLHWDNKKGCFTEKTLWSSPEFLLILLHFCKVSVTCGNGTAFVVALHNVTESIVQKENRCEARSICSLNYLFLTWISKTLFEVTLMLFWFTILRNSPFSVSSDLQASRIN